MDYFLQLDGNFLIYIQEYFRREWMEPFWKLITSLGDIGWFWIALSIIFLFFKKTRKTGTVSLLALLTGALITNLFLKNFVARVRPYEAVDGLKLLIQKQSDFSFPSGHACASFASAMVLYKTMPKIYGISAVVLASLISFSRLYLGVHYPSDVLAGILAGIFAAWAARRIYSLWRVSENKKMIKN